jgi:hypothetical protein
MVIGIMAATMDMGIIMTMTIFAIIIPGYVRTTPATMTFGINL